VPSASAVKCVNAVIKRKEENEKAAQETKKKKRKQGENDSLKNTTRDFPRKFVIREGRRK